MPQLPSRATAQLTVPATTAYLRHVRILAATIADDCAFDVEAIESLRVAVDELCALAMADATDDAELTVTITTTGKAVELDGPAGGGDGDHQLGVVGGIGHREGAELVDGDPE